MMQIGPELALLQLQAALDFADLGGGARIELYDEAAVATGSAPTGTALASIALAVPCGTLAAGALTLHPDAPTGALVVRSGIPRAARWVNGEGGVVSVGTVTDMAGSGDFRVGGANTAPGETSPTLQAGGLVLLGAVVLD